MPDLIKLDAILSELKKFNARLIAVSKTKPVDEIQQVLRHGHNDFGENYVQELVDKHPQLPDSVNWHFIGHLQTNKVKQIAGFVHLIHGIDSIKALTEVNKQGIAFNRIIDVLIQVHIAREDSKYGVAPDALNDFLHQSVNLQLPNVRIRGLMGMATFTDDETQIGSEFRNLRKLFDQHQSGSPHFDTLSMGMSSDYKIALKEGSNLVRIGSMIFGDR
jgi:pyridoxal phosphate enzyme (YggS family)